MTKKLFSAPFIAFLICGTLIPACVIAYYGFTDRSGALLGRMSPRWRPDSI